MSSSGLLLCYAIMNTFTAKFLLIDSGEGIFEEGSER